MTESQMEQVLKTKRYLIAQLSGAIDLATELEGLTLSMNRSNLNNTAMKIAMGLCDLQRLLQGL